MAVGSTRLKRIFTDKKKNDPNFQILGGNPLVSSRYHKINRKPALNHKAMMVNGILFSHRQHACQEGFMDKPQITLVKILGKHLSSKAVCVIYPVCMYGETVIMTFLKQLDGQRLWKCSLSEPMIVC